MLLLPLYSPSPRCPRHLQEEGHRGQHLWGIEDEPLRKGGLG